MTKLYYICIKIKAPPKILIYECIIYTKKIKKVIFFFQKFFIKNIDVCGTLWYYIYNKINSKGLSLQKKRKERKKCQ